MKKSFMTRVLATGLSLAMAFSLSAATNVTTASAAVKKASTTTFMKVATKNVTEGKTTTTYMNSTATKKYRIKSHTESSVAKKYISVVMTSSRKGLKITAKDGAVTNAGLEKKGVNVKINFAAAKSVAAVKKAKATKYVNLKVAVKAKPVEKLTMTAAATGVKKITVTFNKAVDTTTTKLVVKKVSATPAITSTTFAADAKSAEIVMGTKLTAGTYTVEATVAGVDAPLTADITVEDEKLTSFALVSDNLVASADCTTTASISFKALNQYEEMMPADNIQATCSFGKVEDADVTNPTADKTGSVKVTDINPTLAIIGQTGTLVIVDKSTGVNLNATVTYQSKAVASAATVYGVYSDKTEKLVEGSLKSNEKVTNYWLMLNIQDQYNSDMSVKAIADSKCEVTMNPASVLTNLTLATDKLNNSSSADGSTIAETTYDGKTCILIKLAAGTVSDTTAAISKAGSLNLTIVSANKGTLATPVIKVEDKVLIATLNVSAADTLYAGQDNKLIVEAIDENGNAVTKYDDLKAAVTFTDARLSLKKNSDGTGTFYFHPVSMPGTQNNKWKDSKIDTLIMYANDTTSGKYIVKTVNVTYYADRQTWAVAGVGDKTVTAVVSGQSATFDFSTLKYEDQYGNLMEYKDVTSKGAIKAYLADNANSKLTFASATSGAVTVPADGKATFTGNDKTTASLYLMYQNPKMIADSKSVSDKVYDIKVPISVTTSTTVSSSDLTLTINDGKPIYAVEKVQLVPVMTNSVATVSPAASTASAVVTAKINGKNVVIPDSQFKIIDEYIGELKKITDTNPEKTETKTISAVVQTDDGPQTITADVVISNAASKAAEIKKADTVDISGVVSASGVTHDKLFDSIKIVDQYGNDMTTVAGSTVMTITATGANADEVSIKDNATQYAYIDKINGAGTHTVTVKYVYSGLTLEVDIKLVP